MRSAAEAAFSGMDRLLADQGAILIGAILKGK
jgi:hypothetical protein